MCVPQNEFPSRCPHVCVTIPWVFPIKKGKFPTKPRRVTHFPLMFSHASFLQSQFSQCMWTMSNKACWDSTSSICSMEPSGTDPAQRRPTGSSPRPPSALLKGFCFLLPPPCRVSHWSRSNAPACLHFIASRLPPHVPRARALPQRQRCAAQGL